MQSQEPQKIISLKDAKLKQKPDASEKEDTQKEQGLFELLMQTMQENSKNKARLEKERKEANKSVLRSYKIKN